MKRINPALRLALRNYQLYFLLLPAVVYVILFSYIPLYGIQIAFKDYNVSLGFWASKWVGLKYFYQFFSSPAFTRTITNTLEVSFYSLIFGFPVPVIFALLLNQIRSSRYKKIIQTVTYAPYFISTVVLVSMLNVFLAPSTGFINNLIVDIGGKSIMFMARTEWFRTVYVGSGIWQSSGFGAIIYLSALSSISPELHEAAIVDGASKIRRIWHIDLPGIMPTVLIMLILAIGNLMSVGYEKAFLMQKGMNLDSSEVISTYVYKVGLMNAQYSFATAVGLFNSIVNFIFLIGANSASKRLSGSSLW